MPENHDNLELRLFAAALYQIRVLLSGHVGSNTNEPVTAAAELAYALHNEALAALAGNDVNVPAALQRLSKLQSLLGSATLADLQRSVLNEV